MVNSLFSFATNVEENVTKKQLDVVIDIDLDYVKVHSKVKGLIP